MFKADFITNFQRRYCADTPLLCFTKDIASNLTKTLKRAPSYIKWALPDTRKVSFPHGPVVTTVPSSLASSMVDSGKRQRGRGTHGSRYFLALFGPLGFLSFYEPCHVEQGRDKLPQGHGVNEGPGDLALAGLTVAGQLSPRLSS
ncbi:hypothetical protein GWI33_012965 [Rhynchophorus ferrugineus]|uniref:Uncharacterized protein n=1 Tax=Rhynchophorus ferrugineus TaxID=354439 RepID=A0A834MDP0_RHYFE|nr:hypothetical protein GWI33_012965 [Rhynchophorus ferrugineus]